MRRGDFSLVIDYQGTACKIFITSLNIITLIEIIIETIKISES